MPGLVQSASLLAFALLLSQPYTAFGKKEPIITTDIVTGTGGLLYDMYSRVWDTYAAPHWNKYYGLAKTSVTEALPPDPLAAVCEKVGCNKAVVQGKADEAWAMALQVKATIYEKVSEAYEPLNKGTGVLVDQFERALPEYAGAVPRPLGDFVLFVSYIFLFMYVATTIALHVFKIALQIYCFFCCCGCCRRRGSALKKAAAASETKSTSKAAKKAAAPNSTDKKPTNGAATKAKK
jgi:hypothetical protein